MGVKNARETSKQCYESSNILCNYFHNKGANESTTTATSAEQHSYLPPIQQLDGGTLHIPHGYPYGHQWREFMHNSSSPATVVPTTNNNGGGGFFVPPHPPPGVWHNGWNSTNRPTLQDNGLTERSPTSVTAQSPVNSVSSSSPIPEGIILD